MFISLIENLIERRGRTWDGPFHCRTSVSIWLPNFVWTSTVVFTDSSAMRLRQTRAAPLTVVTQSPELRRHGGSDQCNFLLNSNNIRSLSKRGRFVQRRPEGLRPRPRPSLTCPLVKGGKPHREHANSTGNHSQDPPAGRRRC